MNFFPSPDRRGQIKFLLAKKLPYVPRMVLTGLFLAAGLAVQLIVSFWAGLALLALASLLGMVRGYEARPKTPGKEKWERVTPDEYALIRQKAARLRKWHEDLFDITDPRGAAAFAAVCVLCGGVYAGAAAFIPLPGSGWLFTVIDLAVVLFPLWFSGVQEYLRKDVLVIKTELLERMMDLLSAPSDVQVFPMLALRKTEKGALEPEDACVLVRFVGAPEEFYGMQIRVSVNSVLGRDFPYLYCELQAKPGSRLLAHHDRAAAAVPAQGSRSLPVLSSLTARLGFSGPDVVVEEKNTPETDVLVVRQRTEEDSGYATPASAAEAVVTEALGLARQLLAARARG